MYIGGPHRRAAAAFPSRGSQQHSCVELCTRVTRHVRGRVLEGRQIRQEKAVVVPPRRGERQPVVKTVVKTIKSNVSQ